MTHAERNIIRIIGTSTGIRFYLPFPIDFEPSGIQSGKGKYNLISVDLPRIRIQFIRAYVSGMGGTGLPFIGSHTGQK